MRRALLAGAGSYLVLLVALAGLGYAPRPVALAGLVAVGLLAVGLVWQGSSDPGTGWAGVVPDPPAPAEGADPHLASHVRVIESHLASRTVDSRLRDRLAVIADARLLRRHGVGLADQAAVVLLGEELHRRLTGPPQRLTRSRIDEDIRRIEEL